QNRLHALISPLVPKHFALVRSARVPPSRGAQALAEEANARVAQCRVHAARVVGLSACHVALFPQRPDLKEGAWSSLPANTNEPTRSIKISPVCEAHTVSPLISPVLTGSAFLRIEDCV